jgi:hypothetical protein
MHGMGIVDDGFSGTVNTVLLFEIREPAYDFLIRIQEILKGKTGHVAGYEALFPAV